jgi:hypothetical protein
MRSWKQQNKEVRDPSGRRKSGASLYASQDPDYVPGAPEEGCPPIDLVELPRLKLAFSARKDHMGIERLYSVDHADLFISNERSASTSEMLKGIPHSLLLSNVRGELQVLVPVVAPHRPTVASEPFSTELVLDRNDNKWNRVLSQRYFMYPVHVSLSFLLTKGLYSALYLMLLRLLHRDYEEVYRLADSIATDTKLSKEGTNIFNAFGKLATAIPPPEYYTHSYCHPPP